MAEGSTRVHFVNNAFVLNISSSGFYIGMLIA